MFIFKILSISKALEESYNNADKAKSNAQEAQERYADQASKVRYTTYSYSKLLIAEHNILDILS